MPFFIISYCQTIRTDDGNGMGNPIACILCYCRRHKWVSGKGVLFVALILSRDDLDRCLDMTSAIAAMRLAFGALSTGEAQAPQRQAINLAEQGLALLMPSLLQTGQQHSFGLKIITVMPRNPLRNLPRLSATVLLLDATTGQTLAIMEGNRLTAMRTGAVSGLATDLLARQEADILALFGAGAQAPT